MLKELSLRIVALVLLCASVLTRADELPPGLAQAIVDPDIPTVVDATITGYNEDGHAEIKVNKVYKKGYAEDYKPMSTVSIRNPIEDLRIDKVRIPATIRGYGYDIKADRIAKMSLILPNRQNKRFLFFLSGDLLYGTYNNRFEIRADEKGRLLVQTGMGGKWKPLSDMVALMPGTAAPAAPKTPPDARPR